MDTVANMLVSLKNAQAVHKPEVKIRYSKLNAAVLTLLEKEGFVAAVEKGGRKDKKYIEVKLKYNAGRQGVIHSLKRISTPGRKIYSSYKELVWPQGSVLVVSTSQGLMTAPVARQKKLGGELICLVS